jgi:transcriptional regulator with XRE-family HTH domain
MEYKILVGTDSITLKELRQRRGRTQAEVASAMGTSQANVSKLERQKNPKLSSVNKFVKALGGTTLARVEFPDGQVRTLDIKALQ